MDLGDFGFQKKEKKIEYKEQKQDKKPSQQIGINDDVEKIQEDIRLSKCCDMCKKEVEKEYDICNGEANMELCRDCIISRHKKKGLVDEGYKHLGNGEYEFYSHTTGIEKTNIDNILRVFYGVMSNSVFPYSINITDEKGEIVNCFGVTEQFGDFLIKELGLKKQGKESDDGIISDENWIEWVRNGNTT